MQSELVNHQDGLEVTQHVVRNTVVTTSAKFLWVKFFVVLQILMCEPYKFMYYFFKTTKSTKKIYPRKYEHSTMLIESVAFP